MVPVTTIGLEPLGQGRGDGPDVSGVRPVQRGAERPVEPSGIVSAPEREADRQKPVPGSHKQVGSDPERLPARHGAHEGCGVLGDSGVLQDRVQIGRGHGSTKNLFGQLAAQLLGP
jgi:hypothetical protein